VRLSLSDHYLRRLICLANSNNLLVITIQSIVHLLINVVINIEVIVLIVCEYYMCASFNRSQILELS